MDDSHSADYTVSALSRCRSLPQTETDQYPVWCYNVTSREPWPPSHRCTSTTFPTLVLISNPRLVLAPTGRSLYVILFTVDRTVRIRAAIRETFVDTTNRQILPPNCCSVCVCVFGAYFGMHE